MRTTIRLDEDILAAAEQLRRERHLGLSQAVNELARMGLQRNRVPRPFRQRTEHLTLRVDIINVAEALELLDEMGDSR
jgi:antitoxin component of RelBE/YafQ-DinJ toxin-antitoxin module